MGAGGGGGEVVKVYAGEGAWPWRFGIGGGGNGHGTGGTWRGGGVNMYVEEGVAREGAFTPQLRLGIVPGAMREGMEPWG